MLMAHSSTTVALPGSGNSGSMEVNEPHSFAALVIPPLPPGDHVQTFGVTATGSMDLGHVEAEDLLAAETRGLLLARHGMETFELDAVLADDLDQILRVQTKPYAAAFEREVISGVSIVRALLTGTTPRTDLLAQGSQVASVATLLVNTDVQFWPGPSLGPGVDAGLPLFLIDPVLGYPSPAIPSAAFPAVPVPPHVSAPGEPEPQRVAGAEMLVVAAALTAWLPVLHEIHAGAPPLADLEMRDK
jgi:hypothetical protein